MTISRRTTIKTLGVVGAGSAFSGTVLAQTADEDQPGDETEEPEIGGFRVAHFSPDAPDVDVYVDEQHVLADVAYDDVSPYLEIASGSYQVTITAAGDEDAVVFEGTLVVDGGYYTAAAIGELGEMDLETDEDEPEADDEDDPAMDDDPFDEDEDVEDDPEEGTFEVFLLVDREPEDVQDGTADLRFFHASPGAPNVDIVDEDDGRTLVEDAEFAVPTGYRAIEPGDRTIGVYPAGEAEAEDEADDEFETEDEADDEFETEDEDEVDFDADEDVIEPEDPVAEADVEFDEGLAYTVFAIGYLEDDEEAEDDEMAPDDDTGLEDDEDDRPFEVRPLVDGTREDEEDDVEPEEDQLEPEEEELEEEEIDDEPEEVEPDDEPVDEEPAEEPVEEPEPEPEPEDEPPVEDEPEDPPAADD
ncbi:DUF4397 domain-containing protein [Natrarchaeobaculum aegyptiacum]|uniref:DUF4397 domain-containing protein n=1 Tax=Natrarchaeobaculum aegyptiacum TaxID=745377 RepID=A0A2Z2HQR0_9EURY|nr:DUF4397 domain-containing protein [Natrarchaeobaculum aegyptiacum]ARS89486.1 hypothetical protein B1756_06820 [Natrarchaeobaculum aegyptiacum]